MQLVELALEARLRCIFGGGGGGGVGDGLRAKSDSWSQAFLTETVKTGAKYRNVSYNIFKRCRPFRERVGPPSNSIA